MNRKGFALLMVLWLIAALTLLAGTALALARTGADASRNRILLARSGWAREACFEILLGRYAQAGSSNTIVEKLARLAGDLDSVDLGRETWCSVQLDDPSSRLNLNLLDAEALKMLLGADSLVDALLDWRDPDDVPRPAGAEASWYLAHRRIPPRNGPVASLDELRLIRGFESLPEPSLTGLFTVRGNGAVNLNLAPPPVLRAGLRLPEETIAMLLRRRATGHQVSGLDELLSLASAPARATLSARYQELIQQSVFGPTQLVAVITGHVGQSPLGASLTATLVPLPDRLAVIRRETE